MVGLGGVCVGFGWVCVCSGGCWVGFGWALVCLGRLWMGFGVSWWCRVSCDGFGCILVSFGGALLSSGGFK